MSKAYLIAAISFSFVVGTFDAHGQPERGLSQEENHNISDESDMRYRQFMDKLKEMGHPQKYDETDTEYLQLIEMVKGISAISAPTPFEMCKAGNLEGLKDYLDQGGNPNLDLGLSRTPYSLLASAIVAVQVDCVELLLVRGADGNAAIGAGSTPLSLTKELLQLAEMRKDAEMVVRLGKIIELIESHEAGK